MALLPIDLQTLFTQTTQVGKEQAAQKDAPPIAQSLQGAQLAQRAEARDNAVNEAQNQEEGPEQVKDKKRRGASRRERPPKKRTPPPTPPRASDVLQDPDLGRHIDVSG